MPYESIDQLPPAIRNNLPRHALEIFMAAYNNAWTEYQDPQRRRGDAGADEVARKVAWAAVKKEFAKDAETGMWEPLFDHLPHRSHGTK